MSHSDTDFLAVAGEVLSEFVGALEGYEDVEPHDFYEIFLKALGEPLNAHRLSALSVADYDRLLEAACDWYEVPVFPVEVLECVVTETLRRWPDTCEGVPSARRAV